jgi:hypothetical protein
MTLADVLWPLALLILLLVVAAARREFHRLREEIRTPLVFETPGEGEPRLGDGEAPRPPALAAPPGAHESGLHGRGPSPSPGVYDGETDTHVRAPSGPEVLVYDLLERTKEPA